MSGCRPTTEKVEKRPPEFAKKTAKKNESRSRKNFGVAFFFFFVPLALPVSLPTLSAFSSVAPQQHPFSDSPFSLPLPLG